MKLMVCRSAAAWFFPDHRQKIFRTLPITGKKYFVLYLRWLGEGNFLVQILCGSMISLQRSPAKIRSPEAIPLTHRLQSAVVEAASQPRPGRCAQRAQGAGVSIFMVHPSSSLSG